MNKLKVFFTHWNIGKAFLVMAPILAIILLIAFSYIPALGVLLFGGSLFGAIRMGKKIKTIQKQDKNQTIFLTIFLAILAIAGLIIIGLGIWV